VTRATSRPVAPLSGPAGRCPFRGRSWGRICEPMGGRSRPGQGDLLDNLPRES
jgi:hypothetical protein